MKLELKLSLTAILIIIVLSAAIELFSIAIFSQTVHSSSYKLLTEKVDRLVSLAYEQDELSYEGFYRDGIMAQLRVIDKVRIDYRNSKDFVAYPFIIDMDGRVILHPEIEKGTRLFGQDVLSIIRQQKEGRFEHTLQGVPRHFVYKTYKPWGWIFCETITGRALGQPFFAFTRTLMGVSGFMIIFSGLGILLSSRAYVRPLYLVIERLKDVAHGRIYSSVDIRASGEMKMLVDSFNKMADDLREATRELNDEKEQLDITLRNIGDGVIATDVEARVVLMNKAAEDLTGWRQQEALRQPLQKVFNIINQETRQPCENLVEKAIRLNMVITLENNTVLVSRDGVEHVIADSGSPIKDNKGKITGVVLVFRDNTEKRRTEQELRKLSMAVECSPNGILITDAHGIIEYANPMFTQMTGYTAQEVVKTKARILRPDKLPAEEQGKLWDAISSGGTWSGEFMNKKKNEETYWELVFVSPVKDAHGGAVNLLIIAQDITQRKLFEQKLEKEKEMLEIFHNATVDQELDAIVLKKEVNELLQKSGRPIKYAEIEEVERLIHIEEKHKEG